MVEEFENYQKPTPKSVVEDLTIRLNNYFGLKDKKVLDFGCGYDKRIATEVEKKGAVTTAVDTDFFDKINGFDISWKDFDIVIFSYGIKDGKVLYKGEEMDFNDVFGIKARELKEGSKIAILFTPSVFRQHSHSLVTDPIYVADDFVNLKPIGEGIVMGGEFDQILQLYEI